MPHLAQKSVVHKGQGADIDDASGGDAQQELHPHVGHAAANGPEGNCHENTGGDIVEVNTLNDRKRNEAASPRDLYDEHHQFGGKRGDGCPVLRQQGDEGKVDEEIKEGAFTEIIESLMGKPVEELKELYNNREIEK